MTKRNLTKGSSIKPRVAMIEDVTERKRMEERLRESEEKYRGLVENSPNFIGILQDGILKYVNRTAVGRLGWTYDELVSPSFDPIEKVVAERFRGLIKENVGKRLRGEDVSLYEVSLITRDGSEIPAMVRAAKIIYQGRPAVEFTFSDITERKGMEEELSRSSQFLGSVIENAYVWLNVLDSQQNVLVWNKAAETMSGYSREEVVGHGKIWEWLYPDQEYRKQTMENVIDTLQSGRTDVDTETRIKRKDGQTRIMSWNEQALTDQDGKAIGTIAIGHDITELREMHDELERYSKHLQDSEGKLRTLHQHALQLGSASNIEEIVKSTLDAIEFALGFDVADVYLAAGDSLRVRGTRGAPVGFSEEHLNGRGLVAKAARNQATVRVSDTTKEPDYADRKGWDWTGPHTMLSELAVPVVVDAETVAVLNAESIRLDAFSVEDRNLLEILASHAGSAYKRLNYEGKLIALHKHAQQLASATSLDEIIKYTLDAIESPLGVELADFYVVDTEKECLRLVGLRGWSPSFSELSLRGPGFTVMAANSQQTVRISDISKEEGYVDSAGRSGKAVSTTRLSELAVPVIVEGQTVAVLNVESSQLNAFNDEDQRLLETLAVHVGSALGRLRQVEELEIMARFPSESPNPILRLDRHGTVLSANQASKALLQDWGSGIGEVAPKSWRDLVVDVLSSGEGRNIDIELGGRSYTFLVKPIVEGDYVNLYGADITERKRAEEKLRQSEERYRSLFDRMLDGVYLSTHEGRFVDVNPAFVKMFGYSSKQEMLNITDIKKELYFTPEERGSHILDTDQEEVEVYRMRRKDGSEVWVEDHGGYVHDEQGNIIYHEGLVRDFTERKRLEDELKQYSLHLEELVAERTKELRESEEKYRDLFQACPVSLWEEDFSAVKQFLDELRQKGVSDLGAYLANHPKDMAKCAALVKVINMNKATLDLYDAKSVDEIIGGLSGVLTEESNRAFVGEVVALVQGKKYYEAEFENRTLRGETKHCDVICAVVPGYEQSLAKVLVCIVDLTPQKRLEAELVKSQRLAAIGETAAMVGHDLRNPLQGIAGALHLLKQESLTAKERNEMLQVIEKSLHYSDAIVRDLSEYSAEIQLNLAEATPNSITRDALGAVKVPQNVNVQDVSEDQPTLRVDPERMKRVFINLIENAIDAMPQGGTLTVNSRKFDGNVEIALTDTGSGMPEKVMENLWKPLQTTKAKGLGLGLAICKRIVDAHGGCVSVKSEVGRGTTFTMQLPIRPVEVKQK